ncbi:MAG: tRNA (adenosine(37)-N6)-threonylcarbamoyltransferase complex dimerization subunit type 1 TsaB [Solirubrobacteraceae bacterium]|jgi:tRNA threonylcarbamoyladenosine biosynthesis protein TsaB
MRILGFDTSTRATAVALLDTDHPEAVVQRRDDPPAGERPRHTILLMGLVTETMSAAGVGWDDLDLIAVGTGPGTFTGLRIGVATARALAAARGIGLTGVSTLASLAQAAASAPGLGGEAVLAVLDARRGEVFAAGWETGPIVPGNPLPAPLLAPVAIAPEALARTLAARPGGWLAVGDGAVELRAVLERPGVRVPEDESPLHQVSAAEHCRLAQGLRPESPGSVRPQYLRLPDAEIALRAAHQA